MSSHDCKVFVETLLPYPAEKIFEDAVDGGLTNFCPRDDSMKNFLSKYNNLIAARKQSLLVYQSLTSLKSSNSLMNTLATDGANNYDFTVQNDGTKVPVKKKLTVKIVDIIIDEQPLANFSLSKVLMIEELFKLAPTPALALALALAPALDSSDPSKRKAQVSTRIRISYSIRLSCGFTRRESSGSNCGQ
ncbi:Fasciclin-like arabinogalactan protein 1 [Abeliophyllum distichum]|uniref:Fasciclin-like arabinogalactan protein 1 n=1 Tax=Abeliophyllum distichum TaxID=126358 RepID=A0ABD1NUI3_9LAMI